MRRALIFAVLCGFLLFAATSFAASYYVWGGGGSDGNSGTAMSSSKAWATLAHADDVAGPGDVVYLKGTFTSQQYLNNAGKGNGSSWDKPLTYKIYEDANVNFDGTDTCVYLVGKKYVIFDGTYANQPRARFYDAGIGFRINDSSQVKLTGGIFNPADQTPMNYGSALKVDGRSQYIYVYGNNFNNSTGSNNSECIYIGSYNKQYAVDHVYIYNNSFTLKQNSTTEPQALDVKAYNGTDIQFYNNTIYSSLRDGYAPISVSSPVAIHDNLIDISGQASSGTNAIVYFNMNSGYSPENCTVNIYRNTMIGGAQNASVLTFVNSWKSLTVNLYNNVVQGFQNGHILDFDRGSSKSLGSIRLYHNTFLDCLFDGNLNNSGSSAEVIAKNNIFSRWNRLAFTDTASVATTLNGNVYFKPGVTEAANVFSWDGAGYSFAALRSSANQEPNGTFGVEPPLDSQGRLMSSLAASLDVSSEMSRLPDYNLDIDKKQRQGNWDVGASQSETSISSPSAPHGLRIIQ